MNLEQLLEQHLQASAAEQPAYPADVEAIKARGNRRRFTNRLMIASGVAAAVVLTVALATSLFPGERDVVAGANDIANNHGSDRPFRAGVHPGECRGVLR